MLRMLGSWTMPHSPPIFSNTNANTTNICSSVVPPATACCAIRAPKPSDAQRVGSVRCGATRRRIRYEEEEEEDGDGDEQYWHNEEIAMLELYSESARREALIVHAVVDEQEVEVLIFKGFSSSLSYGTSSNPSRSILPSRAVINSIDRVVGPFDPSNIHYIEKGLNWDTFKTRLITPL